MTRLEETNNAEEKQKMVDTQFCQMNFVLNNKQPHNLFLFKFRLQLLTFKICFSLQIFYWNVSILWQVVTFYMTI